MDNQTTQAGVAIEFTPLKDFYAGIGKRWKIGGGWGCRIQWSPDYAAQRVCGWMTPKPQTGDWLLCEMQSGKTGVWRFGEIEHCGDPHDMFFAPVTACGYVEPNATLHLPTEAQRKEVR